MKHYLGKKASSDERLSSIWGQSIQQGQSLVEYALILVLVGLAFGLGLASTGPAISTAFQNTIYALLGTETIFREYENPGDFWVTVTWVAENPPEQRRIPTRTLAPPTSTPIPTEEGEEGGENGGGNPSQPLGTITPVPTSTPVDITHVAPWRDTVEEPSWYRLGTSPYLGSADWYGQYYPTRNFTGIGLEHFNRNFYNSHAHGILKFPSQQYSIWRTEEANPLNTDEFSVRFRRDIYLSSNTPLQFNIDVSGGIRMWIAQQNPDNSYPSLADCSSGGCTQIFNDWTDGRTTTSRLMNLSSGMYRLYVEHYNAVGTPKILNLDILSVRNPDDTNFVGNVTDNNFDGSTAQCNWNRSSTTDSNSLMYLWDQKGGANTVCYLELRGYVHVPETITQPQFVFWDVWDIGANQAGWFEIGVYTPIDGDNLYSLDRDAIQWHRVNVHTANTLNYNWTRQVYDFDVLQSLTGEDFSGKNVTFRFAFASTDNNPQRWHIDDVQIVDGALGEYGDDISFDRTFALNNSTQANYFLTSGQWSLTNENTAPSPGGGAAGCCSWELRPNGNYTKLSTSPQWPDVWNNPTRNQLRVHYVQLLPMIDATLSAVDEDGDDGPPLLSFWHGYHIGTFTSLEVQYLPEGGTEWLVVPTTVTGQPPVGELVSIRNNNVINQRAMRPVDVPLDGIPVDRYQLRFALSVHGSNTQQYEGWWIDNIKLHREDGPRFLDYPLFDNAENGTLNWLTTGDWWVTNEKAYSGGNSFTDSPLGNYSGNLNDKYMVTIFPIDLKNNTPENLNSVERPGGNSNVQPAVNPQLSFWHQRDLGYTNTGLVVEWKRNSEPNSSWRVLWQYTSNASYNSASSNVETRVNSLWEYASISLVPVLSQMTNPSNLYEDDILVRFRLNGNYASADGWYIDDIRLAEKPEESVHRLWDNNATIAGQPLTGNGLVYTASPDDSNWQSKWRLGGDWNRITWESHTGLSSFHDSPVEQESAPIDTNSPYTASTRDSFSVLEMTDIIDLRGTPLSSAPTLYFWTRYHTRSTDRLRVQVSFELLPTDTSTWFTNTANRCGANIPQCYEQEWGWSRWLDIPNNNTSTNSTSQMPCNTNVNPCSTWNNNLTLDRTSMGWQRMQVDLSYIRNLTNPQNTWSWVRLAQDGSNIGRRIRIRFVSDIGKHSQPSDGWYITDVSIEPRRVETVARISEGPFIDAAENMYNWVAEGGWGLDPTRGLIVDEEISILGVWEEYWWRAANCNSGGADHCISNHLNNSPYPQLPSVGSGNWRFNLGPFTRMVTGINYGDTIRIPGFFPYDNLAAGRWILETPVVGGNSGVEAGEYYFVARADDGIRMRWEEIDTSGNVIVSPPMPSPELGSSINRWNILGSDSIDQYSWAGGSGTAPYRSWRGQSPTTYIGYPLLMENGKRYRIILEYFDSGGGAVLSLNVRRSLSMSFSDTPRISSDITLPDVPPINYANTSLILDGTLDLSGASNPQVLFQTTGRTCNGHGRLRLQHSTNGGFTWSNTVELSANYNPGVGIWVQHQAGLPVNSRVSLRFNFERNSQDPFCYNPTGTIGVWISQLVIVDGG